jgi:hypothetical protein
VKEKNPEGYIMMKKIMPYIVCVGLLLTMVSTTGIFSNSAGAAELTQPIPASGSTGVTIFIELKWTSSEPGLTYDIYFGTVNPPPLVMVNQSEIAYRPNRLLLNTTYYWQIVSHNGQQTNQSPVWDFTTSDDLAPLRPVILDGPPQAGSGIAISFESVAADPEGDQLYYQWDWGDGNISEWLGPYGFGEHIETNYQWAQNGNYSVKVRTRDIIGKQSDWSAGYNVTIAPQIHLLNMRSGFLYFNFLGFDRTYGYIHSLDVLGLALYISTEGMTINASGSNSVRTIIFEMSNRIFPDQRWNVTSINLTGSSFEGFFIPLDGVYETSAYAYDASGRLIDKAYRQYVIYYEWKFVLLKQLLGIQ